MYIDGALKGGNSLLNACENVWKLNTNKPSVSLVCYHLLHQIFSSVFCTEECDLETLKILIKVSISFVEIKFLDFGGIYVKIF